MSLACPLKVDLFQIIVSPHKAEVVKPTPSAYSNRFVNPPRGLACAWLG